MILKIKDVELGNYHSECNVAGMSFTVDQRTTHQLEDGGANETKIVFNHSFAGLGRKLAVRAYYSLPFAYY